MHSLMEMEYRQCHADQDWNINTDNILLNGNGKQTIHSRSKWAGKSTLVLTGIGQNQYTASDRNVADRNGLGTLHCCCPEMGWEKCTAAVRNGAGNSTLLEAGIGLETAHYQWLEWGCNHHTTGGRNGSGNSIQPGAGMGLETTQSWNGAGSSTQPVAGMGLESAHSWWPELA